MRDDPNGADLLDTARAMLRNELIDLLPPERRGLALMIANAMAIAARQLDKGGADDRLELDSLKQLLDQPPFAETEPAALRAELLRLNRRLCGVIRDGGTDPGTALHASAGALLLATARRKVEESNPKYLAAS